VSADNDSCSSAELVFFTSTPYLVTSQPPVTVAKLLVIVAVLGASEEVTVTLLEFGVVKLPLEAPWPLTVTVSMTNPFSA
jgi:hypothetical protein